MKIEMGESLFYSWLRHIKGCQIVQTNWKSSPQWPLLHVDELEDIKAFTDCFFQEKYGYSIYKKSSSLSQIIQQGESDALGVSMKDGQIQLFAVDVAFHEYGLQYGGREATVSKILNKCIRTAMCIYGYFGVKRAEVIFASPKVNPSVMNDAEPCVAEAQALLTDRGYDFSFRIIANSVFKEEIITPLLSVSSGIADVPQNTCLFEGTVLENISFFGETELAHENALRASLPEELLSAQAGGDRGQTLSGGEKTRLAVARALSSPAPILIFDEPTSGLDPETAAEIETLLHGIEGKTVVIITHNWQPAYLDRFDDVIKIGA